LFLLFYRIDCAVVVNDQDACACFTLYVFLHCPAQPRNLREVAHAGNDYYRVPARPERIHQ